MLKHSCKEFASPFHSISPLKALVGLQNKIKTWGFFQKWKPSLIKVKEVGGYNSFVKPLKVEACANGRQGGKCQQLSPVRKWKDSSPGLCWGGAGGRISEFIKRCAEPTSLGGLEMVATVLAGCLLLVGGGKSSMSLCLLPPQSECPTPRAPAPSTPLRCTTSYIKKWSLWLDSHIGFFNLLVYFGSTPEHFVDGQVSWP